MSKHAPVSWAVSESDTLSLRIYGPNGRVVVHATQRDPHPTLGQGITAEDAMANARLIDAVRDLLEALEYVIQEGQVFTSAIEGDSHSTDFEAWAVRARSAIVKAKGLPL
ncbi:hypothetical protein [Pseudomonas sp.]|uniref:hypothetical protein n=1 Tax=Pseudomonas sp. TaxID=306 RepID=UPI00258F6507|nr:hypothetical protein [Pseudomonas sp.]